VRSLARVRRIAEVPDAARKVGHIAEVLDVRADEALLEKLEEAMGENARLHAHLEVVVTELERSLVPLLEKSLRRARPAGGAREKP